MTDKPEQTLDEFLVARATAMAKRIVALDEMLEETDTGQAVALDSLIRIADALELIARAVAKVIA